MLMWRQQKAMNYGLYIAGFVQNIGKMTAVGIGALVVVALMLIPYIDKTMNRICRYHKKRPRLMISLSIYWMVLTLGPILLGASIAVTSYILLYPVWRTVTLRG